MKKAMKKKSKTSCANYYIHKVCTWHCMAFCLHLLPPTACICCRLPSGTYSMHQLFFYTAVRLRERGTATTTATAIAAAIAAATATTTAAATATATATATAAATAAATATAATTTTAAAATSTAAAAATFAQVLLFAGLCRFCDAVHSHSFKSQNLSRHQLSFTAPAGFRVIFRHESDEFVIGHLFHSVLKLQQSFCIFIHFFILILSKT